MPTATDLVTDLPADFEVFGQAVDTDFVDLLGGTTGQILSKTSATDLDFTWIANDQGDITAVNTTAPLAGGATSGAVTLSVTTATTSATGVVQLSDSTSTTSSVLAATPTAVKSAYDLANNAIPKTLTTTTGDTIYASAANTPARLGIGTTGQVLTVAGGIPSWAAASAGATGWALLNAGGTALTAAATITVSSISAKQLLILVKSASSTGTGWQLQVRVNTIATPDYTVFGQENAYTTTYAATNFSGRANYSDIEQIRLADGGNNAADTCSAYLYIDLADQTGWKNFQGAGAANSAINGYQLNVAGIIEMSAAITSISILTSVGTFDAGTVYVMGAN
jgi:hypothetical protein